MKKEPRAKRPSEDLHSRGHFSSHGKGEVGHAEFHAMDHGSKADHMTGRTGKADGEADGI